VFLSNKYKDLKLKKNKDSFGNLYKDISLGRAIKKAIYYYPVFFERRVLYVAFATIFSEN
jgi:hypothetical protein